jgi:hypothetical protein
MGLLDFSFPNGFKKRLDLSSSEKRSSITVVSTPLPDAEQAIFYYSIYSAFVKRKSG